MNKKLILLAFIGFVSLWCLANHPPRAHSQVFYTQLGVAVDIQLLAEDPDSDPLKLEFEILTPPRHGKLLGTPPTLQYVPNPGFEGEDRFSFRVHDEYGSFDLGIVKIVVIRVANTIKIVPNPPRDLALNPLVNDFLVQNGVRTWYVVDFGKPRTVAPKLTHFIFVGSDSPRFFLLSLGNDYQLSPVPYTSSFLDLRAVASGEYLLLVLAGNSAYSLPIVVAKPAPDRALVYGGD